jgi:hypothetical protein
MERLSVVSRESHLRRLCGIYTIAFADMVALGIHPNQMLAMCGGNDQEAFKECISTALGGDQE